jgi:hypothetical protein
MKRDEIETLKHNAKLDVRLPDQLKDEFLARCREEGVSSGAVIRSLIIDYVKTRPRPVLAWLDQLKEMMVRRSKWIAGSLGGAAIAGLAAMSSVFAPLANAEDVEVEFSLQLAETAQSSNFWGDYQIAMGEPMMLFFEEHPLEGQYGLIIKVSECSPEGVREASDLPDNPSCEVVWEIEIFEAVNWHENELGGVSVTEKRILATPLLSARREGSVSFEIGSVMQDGTPVERIYGELLLRSD